MYQTNNQLRILIQHINQGKILDYVKVGHIDDLQAVQAQLEAAEIPNTEKQGVQRMVNLLGQYRPNTLKERVSAPTSTDECQIKRTLLVQQGVSKGMLQPGNYFHI